MKQPTFKKIILDDLKKSGLFDIIPKIKSITFDQFAGGNSVNVRGENLFKSERETLEKLLSKYQYGHFDGMIDLYEYSNRRSDLPRQAKFVNLRNEFSEVIYKTAKHHLENSMNIIDDKTAQDKWSCWYDQAVWRIIQEIESFDHILSWLPREKHEFLQNA